MIPAYFVSLEKLPLSTNGKINRKFLPPPEMKTDVQYAAPRDNIEQKLVEIWSDVLGWDADMGIDDNFFEMGGHSLKATILMSRIHKEFNIKLPLADIFTSPTIRELSDILKRVVEEKFIPIEPAEEKGYYTLSSAQKRLYFLQQMDLESTAYNISQIVLLEGEIDMKRLENTFNKLIARHESLRTSFLIVDDIPVQKIHDPITLKLQCHEKEVEVKEGDQIHHFIRPFELSTAPLICVSLIKTGETKHLLIVDMHHIISDGVSQNLLIQNFVTLYKREDLPGLRLQYKDYSQWQNCDNQKKVSKQQKEYWLKEFAGHVPILNLPVDYLRPGVQSFEGSALDFEIGIEETKALNNLAKKEATTLFVVLLTVFNILLSKISNQQDIIIGTPVAGRKHADLEHIIGMFVNTLAVRNFPINEKRVTEFLREVNENTLNAFENQDYPFEELVEQVEIDRDVSRNPLFEVMFVFQNMDFPKVEIAGLKISPYKHKSRRSKFDLGLSAVEAEEKLLFSFEYCTKLFKQGTIEKFISFYKKIISSILNNANKQISQLEIISEQEKKQILFDFNDTEVEYPQDKTIHELFAEQVNRTPDNIAVVGETHQLHEKEPSEGTGRLVPLPVLMSITYKELNERSNHLAHLLQTKNVKPDTIAAIMVDRSLEMITAVFGILKAGGAYLPIEPGYPGKRINYMLADSRARVLVTTNILAEEVKKNFEIIFLDSLEGSGFYPSNPLPFYPSGPSNLAYVIYTSGTTGKPKGVLVETRNAVNLVWGLNHKIYKKYNRNLRICLLSPFVFDASVKQIFAALLLGHSLYIVPEEARLDGSYLLQYYKKHKIDISDGTPTHLRILLEGSDGNDAGTGVKEFIIGGEVLPQDIVREFFNKFTKNVSAIVNIYGPSECTVDSTLYEVTTDNVREFQDNVPIGTPMPNCRVYVLDCWKRLQPVGIPGELYVSGTGVGRGYLNRAPLTAEKFIPEPFNEGKKTNIAVHKMYRTGDLARMLPGGSIEFLGRTDNQVKIRGFRIELGEIEAHLLKHEKIKNVVVLIKERNEKVSTPKDHGEKYITVYFTSDEDINVAQLKIFLSERLPQYMIPSYFVQMEKIPLTHNGKVDRKALDSYGITGELGVEFVAPESEMEKIIANIWKEVLDADKVGVHDNFFDIGGHSLSLIKVNSRLKTIFHKDIPIADMFGYPTISSLVRYFTQSENRELSAEVNERIDEAVGMMDEATDVLFADEID
jgi:fengycin family lipopeptide synthetase D